MARWALIVLVCVSNVALNCVVSAARTKLASMNNSFDNLSKFASKILYLFKRQACVSRAGGGQVLTCQCSSVQRCCCVPRLCLSEKLWKRAWKKRVHAVAPLVVDCVLIYFNPTPGFSGGCCRCLKFNKAFNVSAGTLRLPSVHGLTQWWRLSPGLWQQLWHMLIICHLRYVFIYILHLNFSISDIFFRAWNINYNRHT